MIALLDTVLIYGYIYILVIVYVRFVRVNVEGVSSL